MDPLIPNEKQQLSSAFLTDIRSIIDTGCRQAYAAVEQSDIVTFWNIGRRIVEEKQIGHIEELRREIEHQKQFFSEQHSKDYI